MPTTYRGGKKKTAAKKQTGKKGSKSGSKKGGSGGGGGGDALVPSQDPIVITGGSSVDVKFKLSQFRNNGGGNWKNALANLASITVDGVTTTLSRTSVITINFT